MYLCQKQKYSPPLSPFSSLSCLFIFLSLVKRKRHTRHVSYPLFAKIMLACLVTSNPNSNSKANDLCSYTSHILGGIISPNIYSEPQLRRWTVSVVFGVPITSGFCWPLRMSSVFRQAEMLNQVSNSWIPADLQFNTTNRTSDGVRQAATEEHLGRSDRSVWHSWNDMGITRSSEWNSQNS